MVVASRNFFDDYSIKLSLSYSCLILQLLLSKFNLQLDALASSFCPFPKGNTDKIVTQALQQ